MQMTSLEVVNPKGKMPELRTGYQCSPPKSQMVSVGGEPFPRSLHTAKLGAFSNQLLYIAKALRSDGCLIEIIEEE